jgi:hypothetical protein
MNLHLEAVITSVSKVGTHNIVNSFELWQTPTEATRSILKSSNKRDAYIKWVKQFEEIERVPRYAETDIFGKEAPVGYVEFNRVKEHIEDLDLFLQTHAEWNLDWYEL